MSSIKKLLKYDPGLRKYVDTSIGFTDGDIRSSRGSRSVEDVGESGEDGRSLSDSEDDSDGETLGSVDSFSEDEVRDKKRKRSVKEDVKVEEDKGKKWKELLGAVLEPEKQKEDKKEKQKIDMVYKIAMDASFELHNHKQDYKMFTLECLNALRQCGKRILALENTLIDCKQTSYGLLEGEELCNCGNVGRQHSKFECPFEKGSDK